MDGTEERSSQGSWVSMSSEHSRSAALQGRSYLQGSQMAMQAKQSAGRAHAGLRKLLNRAEAQGSMVLSEGLLRSRWQG